MKKFTIAAVATMMAASAMAVNNEPLIDCDGDEVLYTQYFNGYSMGYPSELTVEDAAIYFDGDMVYFLNIDGMEYDTFTVGQKKGNKIEMVLPQLICIQEGILFHYFSALEKGTTPADVLEWWGEIDPFYGAVSAEETIVTFTIADDGTITLDTVADKAVGTVEVPDMSGMGPMFAWTEMKFVPQSGQGSSVSAVESAPASVEYFDMSGRAVANPAEGGIYVKVATNVDGSRNVSKILKQLK